MTSHLYTLRPGGGGYGQSVRDLLGTQHECEACAQDGEFGFLARLVW
ncbi:hypothetical protein ACWD1Z_34615 [Streptomyces sp. NPDC002784]